ncbi:hypothetical protein A6B43_04270 [Vespertiliibacter pulmonis]|nr:hypothetical protein A6B43_04270 [Vespertiliibacter pulmonis]
MKNELAEIRVEGFAMDREENELGVVCVACPIFNLNNRVEYAISISVSTYKLAQLNLKMVLTEIQRTAQAISKELGWDSNQSF